MTSSDATIRTFATFRVSGDKLDPDELTTLFRITPTLAYAKGERYVAGPQAGTLVGRTGVWYLSTDTVICSPKLSDHIYAVFAVLALDQFEEWLKQKSKLKPASPKTARKQPPLPAFMLHGRLRQFSTLLKRKSLTASMSCFWHGGRDAKPPAVPRLVSQLFQIVPIAIETDFDIDGSSRPSRERLQA
jgi:Domain of unknown function (DUF4279)